MLKKGNPAWVYALLGVWALAAVVAGAVLCSYHLSFEAPDSGLAAVAPSASQHSWLLVHVLSEECGCSQRVMTHLLARGRIAGVSEEIVLVDGPEATPEHRVSDKLEYAGFPLRHADADELLRRYHLVGVPVLIITNPAGRVVYRGGYGSAYDQDAVLLQAAQQGRTPPEYPVIGCAVGARIQRQVDPFRWKYKQRGSL